MGFLDDLARRVPYPGDRGRLWHDDKVIYVNRQRYQIAGVTASVETAGEISHKHTLTRNLLLLGKTKKVDSRQAYILFEGPDFQAVFEVKPNDLVKARAWCASVNTAAKKAAS